MKLLVHARRGTSPRLTDRCHREPVWQFKLVLYSHAPVAAHAAKRKCRRTPARTFTSVRVAGSCSNRTKVIAVCSVHLVAWNALRCRRRPRAAGPGNDI